MEVIRKLGSDAPWIHGEMVDGLAQPEAGALPSAVPVLLLIPRTARVRPAHVKDDSKDTHFLKDLVSRSDVREISQRLARVGLPEYQPDRGWRRRHQEDDDTVWDSTCRRKARGQIVGVALVALPGQRHTSSLSMLSREHRMLSKFFFAGSSARFGVFSHLGCCGAWQLCR